MKNTYRNLLQTALGRKKIDQENKCKTIKKLPSIMFIIMSRTYLSEIAVSTDGAITTKNLSCIIIFISTQIRDQLLVFIDR